MHRKVGDRHGRGSVYKREVIRVMYIWGNMQGRHRERQIKERERNRAWSEKEKERAIERTKTRNKEKS